MSPYLENSFKEACSAFDWTILHKFDIEFMILFGLDELFGLLKSTIIECGVQLPSIVLVRLLEMLLSLVSTSLSGNVSGLTLAMSVSLLQNRVLEI